jgi:hypothetical protein
MQHPLAPGFDAGGGQELIDAGYPLRRFGAVDGGGIDHKGNREAERRRERVPQLTQLFQCQYVRLDPQCGCRAAETVIQRLTGDRCNEGFILEMLQDSSEQEEIDGFVGFNGGEEKPKLKRQGWPALQGRIVTVCKGALVAQVFVNFNMVQEQRSDRAVWQVIGRRRDADAIDAAVQPEIGVRRGFERSKYATPKLQCRIMYD